MKTLLVGNFGARNIGDELILASALEDYPDSVVMTVDGEYSQTFTEKEFETVPFVPTGIRSFLRFLFSAKYQSRILWLNTKIVQVVFPGGGLFAITFRACFLWFLVFLWMKHLFPHTKVIFEHQGVDSKLNWINRKLTSFVLSRADEVSVRDEMSRQAVQYYCRREVKNVGDRVQKYVTQHFQPQKEKDKLVLVNAKQPWKYWDLKNRFPVREKIFIGFDPSDMHFVPQEMQHSALFPKNKTELINLFQKAEFVVGMRFHSLLLGAFFCSDDKTFVLQKPYSEKVQNFVREHGLSQLS
ncbi:polysaccharide pyruvyl transferase family protein [Candidatus Gracilibacteria bacterium]|nr:polysaccharide pyruvyl transferase family protein [Candidatus Gracilibacteria bacterium]